MGKKEYTTSEILCCDLRAKGLTDDHTAVLQTSPRVPSTAPGQDSDLGDDGEVAAKPIYEFTIWEGEQPMIRLSYQSEAVDARTYFYKEMMYDHVEDVLKRITLDLFGVCLLRMIVLYARTYGLIG